MHVAGMKVDVWKTPSFRTTVQHDDVRNVRNDFEHYIKTAVRNGHFYLETITSDLNLAFDQVPGWTI